MRIEFVTTSPEEVQEDVVRYWSERGQFPGWSIEQHQALWAWRYRALSDGPVVVCVARDRERNEVVGHIAVYRRTFTVNGRSVRVGLPGSLALRPEYQGGLAGAKLAGFPRQKLRDGEFDVVLGFSNLVAHEFLTRTGASDLGPLGYHVDLRQSATFLRQRAPALAALAAPVDVALSIRRSWRRPVAVQRRRIEVRPLTADEFRALDRSQWTAPRDRVVSDDSAEFVVRRYLECPYASRTLYGLFDRASRTLQGYAVTEGRERVDVWTCRTNAAHMDTPSALRALAGALGPAEAVTATTSRDGMLSRELVRAGFVLRPAEKSPNTERRLNMTITPGHASSSSLEDFSRWDIWLGASQY